MSSSKQGLTVNVIIAVIPLSMGGDSSLLFGCVSPRQCVVHQVSQM